MDFFELQEFFKSMYPGKLVTYEFDQNCYYSIEVIMTEGLPNVMHHLECRRVKVKVDGVEDKYVPLSKPHRMGCPWSDLKSIISKKTEVWISHEDLKELKAMKSDPNRQKEFDLACKNFEKLSEMNKEWVISKIEALDKK
jgi:hypothetical protein